MFICFPEHLGGDARRLVDKFMVGYYATPAAKEKE